MLSGETAAGKFPIDAVRVMRSICREAEYCVDHHREYQQLLEFTPQPMSPEESLASTAVRVADKTNAKCIINLSANGNVARLISKYSSKFPVLVGVVARSKREAVGFESQEFDSIQVVRSLLVHKA